MSNIHFVDKISSYTVPWQTSNHLDKCAGKIGNKSLLTITLGSAATKETAVVACTQPEPCGDTILILDFLHKTATDTVNLTTGWLVESMNSV